MLLLFFKNMWQIIGEELGVLPGMDPIFSLYALERLVGLFRNVAQKNHNKDKFDIIIYDGMSSEEIIRMISAASKARLGNLPSYPAPNPALYHVLIYILNNKMFTDCT